MEIKQLKRCCICGCLINNSYGENNPDGAVWKDEQGNIIEPEFEAEDVCCNDCNSRYVIPGRLYRLNKNRGN